MLYHFALLFYHISCPVKGLHTILQPIKSFNTGAVIFDLFGFLEN